MNGSLVLLLLSMLSAAPLSAQSGPEKPEGTFMEEWQRLFDDWNKPGKLPDSWLLELVRPRSDSPVGEPESPRISEGRTYGKNAISRLEQAWRDGGKWRPESARSDRATDGTQIVDPPTWVIGLMVEPIEPFVRKHLGLEFDVGMRVNFVSAARPATKSGIRVDDILYRAGGYDVTSLDDLKREVDRAGRSGHPLKLEWLHDGQRKHAELRPVRRESRPVILRHTEPPPPKKQVSEIPLGPDPGSKNFDELRREFENQKFELKK